MLIILHETVGFLTSSKNQQIVPEFWETSWNILKVTSINKSIWIKEQGEHFCS